MSRKRRAISDADGSRSVGKETRQNGFHVSIPVFDEESHGTVRDGALEIAFKKFAGGLGPDSLARIRNQGRRSEGLLEVKRRAAGAQNLATLRRRPVPRTRSAICMMLDGPAITLTRHLT